MDRQFIRARIPHRPPFLWLDRVLALDGTSIRAEKEIAPDLELFRGHYPDYPIMPGVLLCEAVFQAGALLIGEQMRLHGTAPAGVPVLSRIQGARFKREVRPGDRIEVRADLLEQVGPAWFLKGSVRVRGRVALQVRFSCTLRKAERQAEER
ncbi:3-hydroxyacyl-ACP dehydratase FabZ family protein [Thermodesulfobacteriota bacterium B35]